MIELQPCIDSIRQSKSGRFATLWTITRSDGVVLRFTDFQQEIEYESNTYSPISVSDMSAVKSEQGVKERNRTFLGYISSSSITEDDLRAGKYDDAKVTEVGIDWQYPWQGQFFSNTYYITEMKWTGETWEADINGLTTKLRQVKGYTISRRCRWQLGDSDCGVNLATHTETGEITLVSTQRRLFSTDLISFNDGYFKEGLITFTSGNNNGLSYKVNTFSKTAGQVTLLLPTDYDLSVGDTFSIYPGCDHTENHCKGNDDRPWSSNFENFGGFPHVPGTTNALITPDSK